MDPITGGTASYVALVIIAAQVVGRAIPDNATGVFGVLRKVAKIIGLYVRNR